MTAVSRALRVFLSLLSLSVLSQLSHADTNTNPNTNTDDSLTTVSSLDDLDFDDNGKLSVYHIVYPADENASHCVQTVTELGYHYRIRYVGLVGDALREVFPDYENENPKCQAAFLEQGTDRSVVGFPMPHKRWLEDANASVPFLSFFRTECTKMEICLMNYWDEHNPLKVYWINEKNGGEEVHTQTLHFGERHTRCFNSFLGHKFVIKDSNEQVIDHPQSTLTVDYPLILGFGESPQHVREPVPANHYDQRIHQTLHDEWERHNVPQRTFSPLGFAKGRLPNDVFASMGAFFYNNQKNKYREEWGGKGVFVNWWQSDVFMMQIPWSLKGIWQVRLADLVSEWIGMPCEQTVMYGLRQYEAGARLLTHVDRLSTHVVSLIVNVAQEGLEQDWPVEVFDHAGRLHEVVMEAGDVVYYESAKALHSRNRPLIGENAIYVNLFTHYRPKEMDENWYSTPTPEDQVQVPEIDLDESCTVPPEVTGESTEYLGYGRVKCKDPRLGKYLSPSLHEAKNADDLIAWWIRTAPEGEEHIGVFPNDTDQEVPETPIPKLIITEADFDDDYYDEDDEEPNERPDDTKSEL